MPRTRILYVLIAGLVSAAVLLIVFFAGVVDWRRLGAGLADEAQPSVVLTQSNSDSGS